MIRRSILLILFLVFAISGMSQTARQTGLREYSPAVFAFTNARIITGPGSSVDSGTLLIRDGVIEAVGRRVSLPADAQQIDLGGKYIYPGFIEIYGDYGLSDPKGEELVSQTHWSPQVRPFYHAGDVFRAREKEAEALRSQGFVMVHVVPRHGIFPGQGAVVLLGNGSDARLLIREGTAQAISLRPSSVFERGYPHSTMGALSLIRQTFLDAAWYAEAHAAYAALSLPAPRPEKNLALDILAGDRGSGKPFIFDIPDEQWVGRAGRLAEEFGLNLWIKASGYEYREPTALAGTQYPVIVPLDFPKPPDAGTPEATMELSLEVLRHWHLAPGNPAAMARENLVFALTGSGLQNKSEFLANLRKAVSRGLAENEALAALTTVPAKLLGLERHYGTIEKGKAANIIVASGNLFDTGTDIEQVWIDGRRYPVKAEREDPRGEWLITSPPVMDGLVISIEGETGRLRGHAKGSGQQTRLQAVKADSQRLSFRFHGDSIGLQESYHMSANLSGDELLGLATSTSGQVISWHGIRQGGFDQGLRTPRGSEEKTIDVPVRFPSVDFGMRHQPARVRHVLITNATLWTQGPEGIVENADMLVSDGRIAAVGHGIQPPRGASVVDATGMHVTPGLIDPHLHTSIAGNVNETANAITSETRILDVIDANNVWVYRLLAGGLTTAKLFHGSANPIGGQDAVIKMRWGATAENLIMQEAKGGLKFALGENVKRLPDRYPNTRMGTEQIIRDAFEAALRYGAEWQKWNSGGQGIPPRRDLQLEPILEVLRGERYAHVHAYRQDEMLMMMRLAEEYGFQVTAFEHALEGYKIADELREHGAAAVVWTDWSSFKVEAADGILQNARLLHDAGVLTSLHSDNTQLSTRMNWEAAKAMKTGIAPVDAMNLITMNPAKILGIDHLTGSLEQGKQADFVIWNGHPMSAFTTAEQTWIEGIKYFDRKDDERLQEEVRQERGMIIRAIGDSQATQNQ